MPESFDWGIAATVVTAVATGALVWVTFVLARHTKTMAMNVAKAHIVATLEPNPWSLIHFDIVVANTGNAVAYDINIKFDPTPMIEEKDRPDRRVPLQKLSVLRPAQSHSAYMCEYAAIADKVFTVTIHWRPSPNAKPETYSYTLNIADFEAMSRLGGGDPSYKIAEHLKDIREDWQQVARGNKRLGIDGFTSGDREKEQEAIREWTEQAKKRRMAENPPNEPEE